MSDFTSPVSRRTVLQSITYPVVSYQSDASPAAGGINLDAFMAAQSDGFWFDYTKLDRMFQEPGGSTPADGIGEAIGLSLDQRLWVGKTLAEVMALQPDLLGGAGAFATSTGWTLSGLAAIASGKLSFTGTGRASFAPTLPAAGGLVRVSQDTLARSTGDITFNFANNDGGTGATIQIFGTRTVSANNLWYVQVAAGNLVFRVNGVSAYVGEQDNISAKLVPGHYGIQPTASAKPVFQADGAKFDGSDDNLLTDLFASATASFIVAKITVPATLAASQVFAGTQDAGGNRFLFGINSSDGTLGGGVGAQSLSTIKGSTDLRGTTVIVGLSCDGSTVKLFHAGAEVYSAAQSGAPNTTVPLRIGALNNNGTAANFFAGAVKEILAGREFLTLARFNQIAAQLERITPCCCPPSASSPTPRRSTSTWSLPPWATGRRRSRASSAPSILAPPTKHRRPTG